MNEIPHFLINKIIVDATVLKRNELGWRQINHLINKNILYLRKTNNLYDPNIEFECSRRVTCLVKYERDYMWLHATNDGGNAYCYDSEEFHKRSMNDIYSFIEDDDYNYDYYDTYDDYL